MNPEQNESQREFEKVWNDTIASGTFKKLQTGKELAFEFYKQACASTEKRLLASRVVGPSNEEISKLAGMTDDPISIRAAIDWYRDNLKLVPLTIEQLLPSDNDIFVYFRDNPNSGNGWRLDVDIAREFIKYLRDFISKRLAGM